MIALVDRTHKGTLRGAEVSWGDGHEIESGIGPFGDGFASLAVLPSNVGAVQTTSDFAEGRIRFGVILGPSGCGKTHLLRAAQLKMVSGRLGHSVLISSGALIDSPSVSKTGALLIDDGHDVLARLRTRQELRSILEIRVRLNRPTLIAITADQPIHGLRTVLPGWDWQLSWVTPAKKDERQAVLRSMARAHRLRLSDGLVRFLAEKLGASNSCMLGAIQCLELVRHRWTRPKHVLEALGLLKGYLHDATGWDLRDFIHESVRINVARSCGSLTECQSNSVALRLMMDCCGLSEQDAASYFDWDPNETYRKLTFARTSLATEFPGTFEACCACLIDAIESN